MEPGRGAAPPGRRASTRQRSGWSRRPPCSATGSRSTCSPPVTGASEDELIGALRDLVGARACWSRPARTSSAFRHALVREAITGQMLGRSGTIQVNHFGMAFGAPFGGYKNSGLGRELGPEGVDAFMEKKALSLDPAAG